MSRSRDIANLLGAGSVILDGAPSALDTLNELAAALGDDENFASTITTSISNHTSATTSVHGIADTSVLATETYVNTAVGNSGGYARSFLLGGL